MPKRTLKTPVFFIATKIKKKPVVVNFYTKEGKLVVFDAVEKVKTKAGVNFYTTNPQKK